MMEIAVCGAFVDEQVERLKHGAGDIPVRLVEAEDSCDCAIVFGNPEPEQVASNPSLRWLQLESVGFGEYAGLDWNRDHGQTVVTNLSGFFADPVAESALAGILALYRGIDSLVLLKAEKRWLGDPLRTALRLLRGAHVVLIGYGTINRRLAELLAPFGCAITPITRGSGSDALDMALADADLVVCTAPATPATSGLLDAARLARLPARALLCNFGRGSILDEDSLADALERGRLAGAVIDVTDSEPLPHEHRFWNCPNIILTQHTGGGTMDELDRKIDVFLANLARFRAGTPLEGIVDFSRGY
ncbi:D-2-hydroxyacid dehydrogenase [Mesorhizobium sp. B4-1-3]|uniref:D-2-hydroxyacid dehydrogenase n=1 Tax=Mesorhizobium sp. B4-1-3 TaxID=2589889 RepID=UPI0011287137|nr:D-2-hydroxyacid dehydrogenase [Mesorhizobium sp. B4-1-3]TPI11177.1 D-2-hydroxyacid dehydrogenase [Mesorhizobium sp. B4-1-3]